MSYSDTSLNAARLRALAERPFRPFGSDLAGQNPLYLMYFPLMLSIVGILTWLLPSNATFVLAAMLGGAIGLYVLVDLLFRGAALRLSTVLGMSLLLGYNVGALNSWLTLPRGGLTIAEYFSQDPASLARAIGACMGAAALLFAIGQLYERPIFGRDYRIDFDGRSTVLICITTLLLLEGYATGQLGFMGLTAKEGGGVNPVSQLILWWSIPAFAYSVCATLNTRGTPRLIIAGCTLVQASLLIPFGRRNFAYAVLLSILCSRLGRYRTRMSVLKRFLVGALGVALIVTASIAFLYLRVAGWGQRGQTSFATRIGLALDTVQKRGPAEVAGLLKADASTRSFDLGYFANLLEASRHSAPLLGVDLLHNIQLMIPSAISADKLGLDPYGEEDLVNMHWGFGYSDAANSLLTAGAADFGIIGVLLYPLLAVFLLRTLLEWLQFFMPPYGAIVIALAYTHQMLLTEQLPAGSMIQVRNSLILAALLYFISLLPSFQWRSPAPE